MTSLVMALKLGHEFPQVQFFFHKFLFNPGPQACQASPPSLSHTSTLFLLFTLRQSFTKLPRLTLNSVHRAQLGLDSPVFASPAVDGGHRPLSPSFAVIYSSLGALFGEICNLRLCPQQGLNSNMQQFSSRLKHSIPQKSTLNGRQTIQNGFRKFLKLTRLTRHRSPSD